MKIVGISGSLREGSLNTQLLHLVKEIAGESHDFTIASIADIPLYNGDVEAAGMPAPVEALAETLRGADALYICTPEYNYALPGVMKNVIDWMSRVKPMPFGGKVIASAGVSAGMLGTALSQAQLRHTLGLLGARMVIQPQVLVANGNEAMKNPSDDLKGFVRKQIAAIEDAVGA